MKPRKRTGNRSLASLVPTLTGAAFAERGFHEASLLTDWRAVVGDELADQCAAISLDQDGTLVVRASGSAAVVIQHVEPQILDRIATYFGFRAVNRLALRQGPMPKVDPEDERQRSIPPAPVVLPAHVRSMLAQVEGDDLRRRLEGLGASIMATEQAGHEE